MCLLNKKHQIPFRYSAFFFISLIFSGINNLSAQNDRQKRDSLRKKLIEDSIYIYRIKKIRPILSIDQRNSYINKTPIKINGLQVVLIVKEKHDLGLGFYTITASTQHTKKIGNKNETLNRSLKLSYMTLFYYYPLIDKKYWEFGFPIETGLGQYSVNVTDQDGNSIKGYPKPNAGMMVFGAGMDLTVKPIPWLGVNVMGGLRRVSDKNPDLNLNGPYYSYGVVVNLRRIIQDYRYYKKKKEYKKELYGN